MNTVGSFGVASASYHWSRVGSALGRLTQYLAGDTAQTWHLLVADDFHLDAGRGGYREALLSFFVLCALSGVPLSWSKTTGGDTVAWVGFEIMHRSHSIGISTRRAEWFTKWTREVADSPTVNMDVFEEGLGRIMYVVGCLGIRTTIPCTVILIPELTPTRLNQKVTCLRCLHPETLVSAGSECEALLVCR